MPRFLVGSCLNLVMAQRLVRTICPHCKEPYKPTQEELEALKLPPEQLSQARFVRGRGCVHCRNTGYYGRTAIFEILEMKPEMRRLIFDGANQEDIREKALELGMVTLRGAGIRKALRGETTIGEVLSGTIEES